MDSWLSKDIDNTLKDIANKIDYYIDSRGAQSFIFSSNISSWSTQIYPQLLFDDANNYEVGLINLETYYSFANINSTNNIFRYFNGITNKTITIATGSYDINDINTAIQNGMKANGDWNSTTSSYYITILPNAPTLGSIITITNNGYYIDFTVPNSIATLLGFNATILSGAINISPNIVDIININSIYVNCDIIKGSYVNGSNYPVLYNFFPTVGPGYKIVQVPENIVYLPLATNQIMNIKIWLTDQNNNIIDFRGESITIRISIRRK
jgi:hypothetical protein